MYFEAIGPQYKRLQITEDLTHLPEETHAIWVDFVRNDEERDVDERTIIRLLRNSNKVKIVQVENVGDELTPERMELLEVIITRAEKLVISQWQSDLAFSSLKNYLAQPCGLKELSLSGRNTQVSINQAQLLFEGVASSSCLKVLSVTAAAFEPDDEEEENYESICNAFLDALQRNRSLKTLDFDLTPFVTTDWDILQRIFKVAILDTKIKSLTCFSPEQFNFPSNLLIEALCNNECKLKELNLLDCTIVQSLNDDDHQTPNHACNNSLETLKVRGSGNFDPAAAVAVARRCRSLVSLNMEDCDAGPHLSLLDPLLIGDEQRLSLQHLELFGNGINEDQAIEFFRKLPQMTCIRKIRLVHNPFVPSEGWVPVLVDAIQRNKSVELLDLDDLYNYLPMPEEELKKACSKIDAATRRNQERRLADEYLALVRSKVLPEKLWPLVLERAQKPISLSLFKTYYGERVSQPSESVLEKDLVNRLLKEKMLQDHLC